MSNDNREKPRSPGMKSLLAIALVIGGVIVAAVPFNVGGYNEIRIGAGLAIAVIGACVELLLHHQ